MAKAQAWSLDILLALVLFIGAIFVFFAFFLNSPGSKEKELQREAAHIIENLGSEDTNISIIEKTSINNSKLDTLLQQNYSVIKNKLRIQNDFCVYIEDENGNILYLNSSTIAKGSSKINVSGLPCFE